MSFKVWNKVPIQTENGGSVEAVAPVIVSASRRTDIPAFHAEWFVRRLQAGYAKWTNPFNGTPQYISFRQDPRGRLLDERPAADAAAPGRAGPARDRLLLPVHTERLRGRGAGAWGATAFGTDRDVSGTGADHREGESRVARRSAAAGRRTRRGTIGRARGADRRAGPPVDREARHRVRGYRALREGPEPAAEVRAGLPRAFTGGDAGIRRRAGRCGTAVGTRHRDLRGSDRPDGPWNRPEQVH